jgi:Icc-related predicted phosphoesterase
MKILFVADLHYTLKQFDWLIANAAGFDAVIIGGDLLDLSSCLDIELQIIVVEKYLARLRELTQVLVSSGNHDCNVQSDTGEYVCQWLHDAKAGRMFVDGDTVEIAGNLITICPWWDGPVSRGNVEKLLARNAGRKDTKWIWIHHAPADQSPVSWTGKKYGGDQRLVEWIHRYEPDLVLSGHIHNAPFVPKGSWIDRIGRTWVFNPGKQIGPFPTTLILDLENLNVKWDSAESRGEQSLNKELNIPAGAVTGPTGGADGAPAN